MQVFFRTQSKGHDENATPEGDLSEIIRVPGILPQAGVAYFFSIRILPETPELVVCPALNFYGNEGNDKAKHICPKQGAIGKNNGNKRQTAQKHQYCWE